MGEENEEVEETTEAEAGFDLDEEKSEGEVEGDGAEKPVSEGRVREIERGVEEARIIAQLTADPEIRAILEARQTGRKIKVVEESEEAEAEAEVDPEKLEDMSRSDLLKVLRKQIAGDLKKDLAAIVDPLKQQLDGVTQLANKQQAEKVKKEVSRLREKFSDFDVYGKPMLELNKENPGLSTEELYLLAKRRAGKSTKAGATPSARKMATERPTVSGMGTRSAGRTTPPKPVVGRQSFSELLEQTLSAKTDLFKDFEEL